MVVIVALTDQPPLHMEATVIPFYNHAQVSDISLRHLSV